MLGKPGPDEDPAAAEADPGELALFERAAQRSLKLASQAGDKAVMAEVLRHLGIEAHAAGRLDAARQRLGESTRLRREIGQLPGAAASDAQRILEQVSEPRAALPAQPGRRPARPGRRPAPLLVPANYSVSCSIALSNN